MDVIAIELLLWAVLIFFFWALKDGLGQVETDIESLGLLNRGPRLPASSQVRFEQPERMVEAIGNYMGTQIYRYAIIAGEQYEFDHVFSHQGIVTTKESERCIAPGLVYVRCHAASRHTKAGSSI